MVATANHPGALWREIATLAQPPHRMPARLLCVLSMGAVFSPMAC